MSKFRILVVDDEEDVRTIERLALSTEFEVMEAHDGLDALEKLERVEPDFVILDVMMPLMDGFETCRAIRKHPRFYDIPVLFLSAKRDKSAIREGYSSGANLYLTKPFDPDRLIKNVLYYFNENQSKPRNKRYTVEQLDSMKDEEVEAVAASPADQEDPFVDRHADMPASASPDAPTPPPQPDQPHLPSRPRVIIVEDNSELVEVLRATLSRDFEVTTACDGLEGVERIIVYQPDLIVLDAMMPKMSGYQLCMSVRRNKNFRRTPVVFISGKSADKDREYCRRLGANDFLPKPFDPADLKARLDKLMALPDFTIRRKKLTMEQIELREKAEVEWLEQRQDRAERRKTSSELQRFIDNEM